MLAGRLGVSAAVRDALAHGHERWDGGGLPDNLSGEAIPLAVRIAVVARDADTLARALPHARLRTLAGSGHVTYAERPDAFATAVTAFAACITEPARTGN